MSQYPPASTFPPAAAPYQPAPSNSLGVAGFVVSLLGLFATCGLLSPVGLIMSAFAMRREPRSLAIAGLVLGILGSLWLVIAIPLGLFAIVLGFIGVGMAYGYLDTAQRAERIETAIVSYQKEHAALPQSLADLRGLDAAALNDHWGHAFRFALDSEKSYSLTTDGQDGAPSTNDDMTVHGTVQPDGTITTTTTGRGSSRGSP
jgi:hypothetical protein